MSSTLATPDVFDKEYYADLKNAFAIWRVAPICSLIHVNFRYRKNRSVSKKQAAELKFRNLSNRTQYGIGRKIFNLRSFINCKIATSKYTNGNKMNVLLYVYFIYYIQYWKLFFAITYSFFVLKLIAILIFIRSIKFDVSKLLFVFSIP